MNCNIAYLLLLWTTTLHRCCCNELRPSVNATDSATVFTQSLWLNVIKAGTSMLGSLITCYNKRTRTAVYQYDSAHCIKNSAYFQCTSPITAKIAAQTYNAHRLAAYCGFKIIKTNPNFCGDESISREVMLSRERNLAKSCHREIFDSLYHMLMSILIWICSSRSSSEARASGTRQSVPNMSIQDVRLWIIGTFLRGGTQQMQP